MIELDIDEVIEQEEHLCCLLSLLRTEKVCNSATIAKPASWALREVDAIGGQIGPRNSRDVVVVPHVHKGIPKNEDRAGWRRRLSALPVNS